MTNNRHTGDWGTRFDVLGAASAAIGLGALTYALTRGAADPGPATMAAIIGGVALLTFWWVERRSSNPMLPLAMFGSRPFSVANLASCFIYGALAALMFVLPIQLQVATGYSALATGLALLPLVPRRDRMIAPLLGCSRPTTTAGAVSVPHVGEQAADHEHAADDVEVTGSPSTPHTQHAEDVGPA